MSKTFTSTAPQPGDNKVDLLGKLVQELGGASQHGAKENELLSLVLERIRNGALGGSTAKVYRALLTQVAAGDGNPVATVLENTLGGTPVWTYGGVGEYQCTLAGAFPVGKTMVTMSRTVNTTISGVGVVADFLIVHLNNAPNFLTLYTGGDAKLGDTPIEILVYE